MRYGFEFHNFDLQSTFGEPIQRVNPGLDVQDVTQMGFD